MAKAPVVFGVLNAVGCSGLYGVCEDIHEDDMVKGPEISFEVPEMSFLALTLRSQFHL